MVKLISIVASNTSVAAARSGADLDIDDTLVVNQIQQIAHLIENAGIRHDENLIEIAQNAHYAQHRNHLDRRCKLRNGDSDDLLKAGRTVNRRGFVQSRVNRNNRCEEQRRVIARALPCAGEDHDARARNRART